MLSKRAIGSGSFLAVTIAAFVAWACGCTPAFVVPSSADPPTNSSSPDDRDGDHLSDAAEETARTDPDNPDTDHDGCPDGLDSAPLLDSVSSCPRPPSNGNGNHNANSNSSANANTNGNAASGIPSSGDHCPFVSGQGAAADMGDGPTTLLMAYDAAAGSARIIIGNQTFTAEPDASPSMAFAQCPDSITLFRVTFDDGSGHLQTFTNLTFNRGADFSCGGTVTLTFSPACNIVLSEE